MAATTISVRKAADIPRYSISGGSARAHFSIPGAAANVQQRFGALTVFNDDVLGPSMATEPRTYAYVDVITYVVDGYFRHDDTLGSDFVLQHGDVAWFHSDTSDLRSIVMSIDARDRAGAPSIDYRSLKRSAVGRDQTLIDVAVDVTRNASSAMPLRQRGRVAVGLPGGFGDRIRIEQDYGAYIYAISGGVGVGDMVLADGDVATITDATDLQVVGDAAAHALGVIVPLKDYGQPSGPASPPQ